MDRPTDISALAEPTFISICTYLLPRERMALALASKPLYSKVHPNLPYIALKTPWWTSWSVSSYELNNKMDPDDGCWCRGSGALEAELDQLMDIVREYAEDVLEVVDIKRSEIEQELINFERPDCCAECTKDKLRDDSGAEPDVPLNDLLGGRYELVRFDDQVEEAEAYECLLQWKTVGVVSDAREAGCYVRVMDRRREPGLGPPSIHEADEADEADADEDDISWGKCTYAMQKLKGSQARQEDDDEDDDSDMKMDSMDVDGGVESTLAAAEDSDDCFGRVIGYYCDFHFRLARLERIHMHDGG
ncbi:hypothetical protein HK102_003186 [Quaeritorhiza haematococci]|nr:hypothetical protein HK102_003186 [Quaeritorhiza haematococci]